MIKTIFSNFSKSGISISFQIRARDVDWIDREGLLYTLTGDGVDGLSPEDAYFSVNPQNGELTQIRVSLSTQL